MARYQITGGKELSGSIAVGGSKNATLPIICATLLTDKECVLRNVPEISDVRHLIEIFKALGSKITFAEHVLTINNSGVTGYEPQAELVGKMRGSILLMGPLLGRFGKALLPVPGGDIIGKRPIDAHLIALRALGAVIKENGRIELDAPNGLQAAKVIIPEMSVTATENVIMAAVKATGTSHIKLAAAEPHVQDLCRMLNKMGAKITGVGSHDLIIEGVTELGGVEHQIIFDNEVACSFINLAAATKSEITITNIQPDYLDSAMIQFQEMNVNFEIMPGSIKVHKPIEGAAGDYHGYKIKPNVYPGLMTDYVPPFAVLATQAHGTTTIHEWMYEGRLGYIHELSKMGANAHIVDQNHAEIIGPCKLHGNNVSSLDVRSGMVMVIAALVADGQSVLHDVEHIERGYEHIVEKLKGLGAEIERFE